MAPPKQLFDGIEKPKRLRDYPRYFWKKISGFFSRLIYIFDLVWQSCPMMLFLMLLFCLLDGVLPVVGAYISSELINEIALLIGKNTDGTLSSVVSEALSPLFLLFAVNLLYLFVKRIISKLTTMVTGISGELVINHIKLMIMTKAESSDMRSFDDPVFFEKIDNATREANMRPISILNATFRLFSSLISAASFVVVLAALSPFAPIVILIAAVPGAIVNLLYRNRNFRYVRRHSRDRVEMQYYSSLMTNKDRAGEVKLLGLGETFKEKYKAAFARYYKGLKKLIVNEGVTQVLVGFISTLVHSLIVVYIAYTVIYGGGRIGDYSLYSGALTSITTYVTTLLTATVTIYEGTLFINNMIEFMEEEATVVPTVPEPRIPKRGDHTIELRNVSFRYPGTERLVLHSVNLTFKTGESAVLVGLNGAGKSTLIKLITRLYDPTEGEILLDGYNIKEYDVKALHSLYGMIFQDFGRYADTVSENIRFGDPEGGHTDADIRVAASRGGAAAFIDALPSGYDTPLTRMFSEDGVELSGGQWQKLSVARAFYKSSDILILDEPTASLDPIAEGEVFERFSELAKDKLAVFVSHKLSSAVDAGKIVVIDGGEIAEEGSHRELMEKRGKYYELFSTQARRYADA